MHCRYKYRGNRAATLPCLLEFETWQDLPAVSYYLHRNNQMLSKHWKLFVVIGVLIWSIMTLIQVVPISQLQRWQHLANLPSAELQKEVLTQLEKTPGWDKMTSFEHEDLTKRAFEESQFGNNIQVLGTVNNYAIITSLKLGL